MRMLKARRHIFHFCYVTLLFCLRHAQSAPCAARAADRVRARGASDAMVVATREI